MTDWPFPPLVLIASTLAKIPSVPPHFHISERPSLHYIQCFMFLSFALHGSHILQNGSH